MTKAPDQIKGITVMAASSVVFSVMAALIRYAEEIDSFKTSFSRFTIGLAIIGTAAMTGKIKLEFKNSPMLFLRGALGGAAVFLCYLSISKLGVAKGMVISHSYAIFATIAGVIFLKEKVPLKTWLIILAALGGIYLIGTGKSGSFKDFGPWDILAVTGSVLAGLAIVAVRKLRQTDSAYAIFAAQCLIGFWIVLIPANLEWVELGVEGGVLLLGIGVSATLAQLMMTWAFRHVNVATGSLIGLLVPVLNVPMGYYFFKEDITLRSFLGMAVVITACALLLSRKRVPEPEEKTAYKNS